MLDVNLIIHLLSLNDLNLLQLLHSWRATLGQPYLHLLLNPALLHKDSLDITLGFFRLAMCFAFVIFGHFLVVFLHFFLGWGCLGQFHEFGSDVVFIEL